MSDSKYAMFGDLGALEAGQTDKPITRTELQGLAMMLGVPAMGHRVHARVDGRMNRIIDRVRAVASQLDELVAAGQIDATQAGLFRELASQVATPGKAALPPEHETSKGFEFLWSPAFEDDNWNEIRRHARAAFTALRAKDDPWLG